MTLSAGTNVLFETTTMPDPATGDWQTTFLVPINVDNCTTWVARQEFTVVGGGQWTGAILLPDFLEDEQACASVYTGTYGENWIETQSSLPILSPEDERATRLYLPTFQLELPAGGIAKINGVAVNAPEVQVSIPQAQSSSVSTSTL